MKSEALSYFPMPWLICGALLIFVTIFVAIFIRTYISTDKSVFKEFEQLPFSGDSHERR